MVVRLHIASEDNTAGTWTCFYLRLQTASASTLQTPPEASKPLIQVINNLSWAADWDKSTRYLASLAVVH